MRSSYGNHGCDVGTLDSGKTVFSKNPDTLLMTASNMKLLTSAAALSLLGADFRYEVVAADTPKCGSCWLNERK